MVGLTAVAEVAGAPDRERSDLLATLAAVRARLGLVALLLAAAGLAWWSTARQMSGMDMAPGSDLGGLGWFVGVWVVMMAAMMFPSVAPTVALYARMTRRRGPLRPVLFTASYLAIWSVAGLLAYGVDALARRTLSTQLSWDHAGRAVAAAILATAAVYELTPLKNVCLARCRSPLGYLLGEWRDGAGGALRLGGRHAAWCLGCCWALMVALFALGVMSLQWMAVVAGLIALEKTLPWHRGAVLATTAVLLSLAVAIVVAPGSIPGLVVPGGTGGGMGGGM